MKLYLFCAMCVGFTRATDTAVIFEKPRYPVLPSELPNFFHSRVPGLQKYPHAIEAVLSVALKLQGIDDHDGKQHNFLVSPLAVAGALGQLMLGAKGDLRKQIGILLTMNRRAESGVADNSAVPTQPQAIVNSTTLQQRLSDSSTPGSDGGGPVINRFGTLSAQTAGSYETQGIHPMPHFTAKGRDGLPGLELHRQLGRLIRDVSSPLPKNGTFRPLVNSSYLHTSTAFFLDQNLNLNEPFVRAIIDFYDSKVVPLNFSTNPIGSQKAVNDWGAQETGGLINHFLMYPPPLDTAVIQAVAVHFRGAWQTPFIPEGTIPGYFKTSANTEVPVKYMRGSFENTYYAENATLGVRLLVLPYSNFECAMYVILPMESNELKFNVGHMITQLNSKDLTDLVTMAKQRTVNVMFPKLSLTGSLSLSAALEKHAAFLNKENADQANRFPNRGSFPAAWSASNSTPASTIQPVVSVQGSQSMKAPEVVSAGGAWLTSRNGPGAPDLNENDGSQEAFSKPTLTLTAAAADSKFRISDIIQQIALEINEAGTEAAAVAGSTVNYSGDVKNFKVNRPFLFFIRQEETNALLFWGTIVDPTA